MERDGPATPAWCPLQSLSPAAHAKPRAPSGWAVIEWARAVARRCLPEQLRSVGVERKETERLLAITAFLYTDVVI